MKSSPVNLYALCRVNDDIEIKRVRISRDVQQKLEGIFQAQYTAFMHGITEEVAFNGEWKPESDEILTLPLTDEASAMLDAVKTGPLTLTEIDAKKFLDEKIKALFVAINFDGSFRLLVQTFTAQQILSRRTAFFLDGDTFKELTAPAFTIENQLTAVIENSLVKFKSFFHLKRVFTLKSFYQEATDQQVDAFCSNGKIHVEDVQKFKELANEDVRRLITAVAKTQVLETNSVEEIVAKASQFGLNITIDSGKIKLPPDRKAVKFILRFLDDGVYIGPITEQMYQTNSKRLLT